MDKSSILGMPMSPQEIFKRYKRQSLGMPQHPFFINKKYQVIFQCAIFLLLHILCAILGASLFLFAVFHSFLFVLFSVINGWTPTYLFWRETRSVFITQNTLVFTLLFCGCSSLLVMLSALVFHPYFVQSWLVFFSYI